MTNAPIPTPEEIQKALGECRPLNDPVRFWSALIGWIITILLAGFLLAMVLAAYLTGTATTLILVGIAAISACQYWLTFKPLRTIACKKKVLFLRAFVRDSQGSQENRVRNYLRAALPGRFSLGGIRAPRHRLSLSLRLCGESILAFYYLGSNRFELEAADRNWFARLLASASQAHAIIVDLRSLTPLVHDEIELAVKLAGERGRLFLVIDDSHTDDEWLEILRRAAMSEVIDLHQDQWLRIPADLENDPLPFLRQTVAALKSIPETPIQVSAEAYLKARQRVAPGEWNTPWSATPAGAFFLIGLPTFTAFFLLSGFLPAVVATWLAYLITCAAILLYYVAIVRIVKLASLQRTIANKSNPRISSTILSALIIPGMWTLCTLAITGMKAVANQAKLNQANADISSLESALMMYKLNAVTYPTTGQGLKSLIEKPTATPIPRRWTQVLSKTPLDPWQREYIYRFPGAKNPGEFDLISKGPDGMEGTIDDIARSDTL